MAVPGWLDETVRGQDQDRRARRHAHLHRHRQQGPCRREGVGADARRRRSGGRLGWIDCPNRARHVRRPGRLRQSAGPGAVFPRPHEGQRPRDDLRQKPRRPRCSSECRPEHRPRQQRGRRHRDHVRGGGVRAPRQVHQVRQRRQDRPRWRDDRGRQCDRLPDGRWRADRHAGSSRQRAHHGAGRRGGRAAVARRRHDEPEIRVRRADPATRPDRGDGSGADRRRCRTSGTSDYGRHARHRARAGRVHADCARRARERAVDDSRGDRDGRCS